MEPTAPFQWISEIYCFSSKPYTTITIHRKALNPTCFKSNYFVYCRSGARSAQACQLMSQLGFTSTYNLLGGILEWEGEVIE